MCLGQVWIIETKQWNKTSDLRSRKINDRYHRVLIELIKELDHTLLVQAVELIRKNMEYRSVLIELSRDFDLNTLFRCVDLLAKHGC